MPKTYSEEKSAALDAVRRAAVLCRSVQRSISPDTIEKKDRSPVTVADFGSQAVVCHVLESRFASDPIIGEEDASVLREQGNASVLDRIVGYVGEIIPGVAAGDVLRLIDRGGARDYSRRLWTLDPIDGTKGFLRSDQYAVALALIEDGEVVVAALACPNLPGENDSPGQAFVAVKDQGAWAVPLYSEGEEKPIHVSPVADTKRARFCESVESGHSSHGDAADVAEVLGITEDSIRLDSQAKYAIVARGDAEIYMRLPTRPNYVEKIWDHAAGLLVVEEAGGRVSDIDGKPLDFSHGGRLETNKGVIATNGHLHDEVLAALRRVGVSG
ncbi:MAG: 3'(2'),5'-bisphosphate nucleotidase [Rhodothermia bacterium]|nr:3'(2'),5'-bisphosphate nucleotidase [Rhodothermia bacterium]